jgi:hypothetical protein
MTVKPLGQLITKHPSGTSSANPKSGKSFVESPEPAHSIDNYEHHSKHSEHRSRHYKEVVIGTTDTGQYGDKAIAKLNPTTPGPAIRSYPGLANG